MLFIITHKYLLVPAKFQGNGQSTMSHATAKQFFSSPNIYFLYFRRMTEIVTLILPILAAILASTAIVSSLDTILEYLGALFDLQNCDVASIGQYILWPFLWLCGLPWNAAQKVKFALCGVGPNSEYTELSES